MDSPAADGSAPTAPQPAGARWTVLTLVLGATYLLGAAVHVWLGATAPETYVRFADLALVDRYTQLWRALVVPNLRVLQPAVVAGEFLLGLALLRGGRATRYGHVAGAVFQLVLVPSGPWGVVNGVLAIGHAVATGVGYPLAPWRWVLRR